MKKLLFTLVAAVAGLWLATLFVPSLKIAPLPDSNFFGFALTTQWQIIVLLGIILGLLNFFVKPILNLITLPLSIITLGLFSFVVQGVLIWIVDAMFQEFSASVIYPLLWTTLIIWGLNLVLNIIFSNK